MFSFEVVLLASGVGVFLFAFEVALLVCEPPAVLLAFEVEVVLLMCEASCCRMW